MRKLLIVDDDPDLLFALKPMLFQKFTVTATTDINHVIEEFNSFQPNIVLIDVWVRGKDGRTICPELRQNPENNKVALILFSASPADLADYKDYGADAAIAKPFFAKQLINVIESVIALRCEGTRS